jgi:hypothetical protein
MPTLKRDWTIMPPHAAQLIMMANGSLVLRFQAGREQEMLDWLDETKKALTIFSEMQTRVDAQRNAEQASAGTTPVEGSQRISGAKAMERGVPSVGTRRTEVSASEAAKAGVPKPSGSITEDQIKRQVKPMMDPPPPLLARAPVVKPPKPTITGRPQGELPEVPPDEPPTGQPSSNVLAPPDTLGPAPRQIAPADTPGPTPKPTEDEPPEVDGEPV